MSNYNNDEGLSKFSWIAIISLIVVVVASMLLIHWKTIEGNEIGVKETMSGGVINEPLFPKTYFYFAPTTSIYVYKVNSTTYVMNDAPESAEFGEGRKRDAYSVESKEGQTMKISLNVRYHLDASKIVEIHKTVRDNIEERILRPELMRIVKDEATARTALEAYSGQGLVDLQNAIFKKLSDPKGDLANRGMVVENFVIEKIELDKAYVGEISQKQIAVQKNLRLREETIAAEQEAQKAKMVAQADYEKAVVEAKRDKEVGILSAEKTKQQAILSAEASAMQVELAAEAQKQQAILEAQGIAQAGSLKAESILAIGQAEAEATKLKLAAYNTNGADAYVKIQVAQSMGTAFSGIKGYLPEGMNVTLLADQFDKAVGVMVNPSTTTK